MSLRFLSFIFLAFLLTNSLHARTYYVSTTGNDQNSGTSIEGAWASIAKVNATHFLPGDTVLFEGESVFEGGIYFASAVGTKGTPSDVSGTAEKPIVFSSYGAGRAIISSDTVAGFKVYNGAGFVVKNLIFRGTGWDVNKTFGVEFYIDMPDTLLEFLIVDSVEVFGYREAGISIMSFDQKTGGFKDVTVVHSEVHDNGDAGIASFGQGTYCHKNLYIGYNKVYNNRGLPDKWWGNSGNGIILGSVDGAIIEYCEAYNNGGSGGKERGGPFGIWGYSSTNLIIQFNEAHHNKTEIDADGGGFDMEGCSNSIMQYNYSHDNDGPGFMVGQYASAPTSKGITVRFNITENDNRKTFQGSLYMWSSVASSGIHDVEVYNNSVFLSPSGKGTPSALRFHGSGFKNFKIMNNIFVISGDLETILIPGANNIRIEGNSYWVEHGELKIKYEGVLYKDLEEWREATGQEMRNGQAIGHFVDPQFTGHGKGVIIGDPTKLFTLNGYELGEESPLIGKALNLKGEYGIDPGVRDFYGNSIEDRNDLAIGAHQPTDKSRACLQGDPFPLAFGNMPEGNYSGKGVVDGGYFEPSTAGQGQHALRYDFVNEEGEPQVEHHSIQILEASHTVWEGRNDDWFDTNNWSVCVPSDFIDATITEPEESRVAPRIKSGQQARARDFAAEEPVFLEVDATLKINGAYNGPPFEADPHSTVIFSSQEEQLIPAGNFGRLQLEGNGLKRLMGAVTISGELELKGGKLLLGDYPLTIDSAGSMVNATEDSYIVTNGSGMVTINAIGGGRPVVFPVGTSDSYTPAFIENAGLADDFSLRVEAVEGIASMQLREGMLSHLWHVEEKTAGGSDIKLRLQWNEQDEPEHFLRSRSFISQWVEGEWVDHKEGYSAAVEGSREDSYTQSLHHIRSLSTFTVGSRQLTALPTAAEMPGLMAWPNPFSQNLIVKIYMPKPALLQLNMTDMLGQLVSRQEVFIQQGEHKLDITLNDKEPAGFYILSASFGGESHHLRVVKR